MNSKLKNLVYFLTNGYLPDANFDPSDFFDSTGQIASEATTMSLSDPAAPYGNRMSKRDFTTWMKNKTKRAAITIINLMEDTAASPGLNVIRYQIIKSATSTSANYRAACRARSRKEFFAKICIVVEECDETTHWLELLEETKIKVDKVAIKNMQAEWEEILRIVTAAKNKCFPS